MKNKLSQSFILFMLVFCCATKVKAQDAFIGEIKMVAFNFAPRGWAECNGQLLPINQNPALFALLGTIYGGDGRTTFALPDLRGLIPVGTGKVPGKTEVLQGKIYNIPGVLPDSATPESSKTLTRVTGVRYVICLQGLFPSRN